MLNEWINVYDKKIGGEVNAFNKQNISGSSSCTQNLIIGLEFAFKTSKKNTQSRIPTLFVISCQNYSNFNGFRLNNPAYTAYPYEEEVLLCEGCEVVIL